MQRKITHSPQVEFFQKSISPSGKEGGGGRENDGHSSREQLNHFTTIFRITRPRQLDSFMYRKPRLAAKELDSCINTCSL